MRKTGSLVICGILISLLCLVLVVQAQTPCPSTCSCMLPSEAAKMKGYSLCGGKQVICGYDKAQNPRYCYQKPATTTATTKPTTTQITAVTTALPPCPSGCSCLVPADANKMGYTPCGGKQSLCGYDQYQNPRYCYQKPATTAPVVTTTKPTPTPATAAPTTCPSTCSCLLTNDGKKSGYTLCGGKQSLCGYDQYQNPQYCFQKPATTSPTLAPATLVTHAIETIEGIPIGTVPPIDTIPMAVAPARCTVSGNIYRFFHDPETLKVRVTNLDTGDSSLSSVTPVYTGDLVSHYSYAVFVQCDGNYRIEPVYQPYTGACAWTGSFSGSDEVHMAGTSVTGQDFSYVPDNTNIPEITIQSIPEYPQNNDNIRVKIEATDDNLIMLMAVRYDLLYTDGIRRSIDWIELTPRTELVSPMVYRFSGLFNITGNRLARAEITARVCDVFGNERQISHTVTWEACYWCGDHVFPVELNGNPREKIDIIFIPDTTYSGDINSFIDDIGNIIEYGYFRNDLFLANREKFNFYYLDVEADITGAPESVFTSPFGNCEGFQNATTFAESIGILHLDSFTDWAATRCGRPVFTSEPFNYRTFVHESGHSIFGLKDEYCCSSHYHQNDPYPNIWATETACRDDATAEGWDPDDCTPFCLAGSGNCGSGFWRIDPNWCIMGCSQACDNDCCLPCIDYDIGCQDESPIYREGMCIQTAQNAMCQFEPACARRVNWVLSRFR